MSKDMMPMFELYQPTDIGNALDLADKLGWCVSRGSGPFRSTRNEVAPVAGHRPEVFSGIDPEPGVSL